MAEALSPAEWEVMRVVWTKDTASTTDIVAVMQQKRDWAESTIKTLLRRLVAKQALTTSKQGRQFVYTPQIQEQSAMKEAAENLFASLCDMKKGAVLADLLQTTTLSQADIQQMQTILAKKAQTAPKQVACNCLGDCNCEGGDAS